MSKVHIPLGPAPSKCRPADVEPLLELFANDVRDVILRHRKHDYISRSNVDDIPTGNRYQTVALGADHEPGFRSRREDLFSRINFEGTSVLDVGCNTGELSRLARRRGATLVDGFDFDPLRIALAQLTNVHESVTRVSFYAADATDPNAYRGEYDIVLAFSVFPYISKALPALAGATKKILILETHLLTKPRAERQYIDALSVHFRFHRELETTDWGGDREGERKVIAFARDESVFDAMLNPSTTTALDGDSTGVIDVARSELGFLEKFETRFRDEKERGFDALLDAAAAIDPESVGDASDVASGVAYWVSFLRGYREFCDAGAVEESNSFVAFLRAIFHQHPFDVGLLSTVNDTVRLVERVQRRYHTLHEMRTNPAAEVRPVELFDTSRPRSNFRLYDREHQRWLSCEAFDGYHRLFSARMTGRRNLPMVCRLKSPPPHGT